MVRWGVLALILIFVFVAACPSKSFCDSDIYTYKDEKGRTRYVDDPSKIPEQFRAKEIKPHNLPNIIKLEDSRVQRKDPAPAPLRAKHIEKSEEYLALFDPVDLPQDEVQKIQAPTSAVTVQSSKEPTPEQLEKFQKLLHLLKFWWPLIVGVALLNLIAIWILLERADMPGYACIIPVYNIVALSRLGGQSGWWILWLFVPFLGAVIWSCTVYYGIARRFGAGTGFAIGTMLLPVVFIPVLAFSRS